MEAPVLILYGSQTGNAQDVAERLGREAHALHFKPRVLPMDAYDVTALPSEHMVIFVTSTTGQGEVPDNMKSFWKFLLRKSLPSDSLAATHYTVFGLGDSGYPLFNVSAKKLARRLQALGGQQFYDTGLGDDQHPSGYEAALDLWVTTMWEAARKLAGPLPADVAQVKLDQTSVMSLGKPKYDITFMQPSATTAPTTDVISPSTGHSNQQASQDNAAWQRAVTAGIAFRRVAMAAVGAAVEIDKDSSTAGPAQPPSRDSPFFSCLLGNRRLTPESHFQETRHLEFDLSGSGMTYQPGDVLAVLPRTPCAAVQALVKRLGLDPHQVVCISPASHTPGAGKVTCTATVQDLVQGALDIAGASPRRYFFQVMSHFARTDMEQDRLSYFASAQGRDDLYTYCGREGRTVVEVLQDFPNVQLPLEWFLDCCPLLRPRLFSISSSHRMHPGAAHVTMAVVEYKTPYNRRKRGLCSSYLAKVQPGTTHVAAPSNIDGTPCNGASESSVANGTPHAQHDLSTERVAVWIEKGSIRMPADPSVPLILIGPGTGVAPFRSFLQERAMMLQEQTLQQPSGGDSNGNATHMTAGSDQGRQIIAPCCLFFGCRSEHADFYYADEFRKFQDDGVLEAGPTGLVTAFSRDQKSKVYVTHRIREHGARLWQLLQQGACIYVSGSAQKMPSQVMSAFVDVVQEHGGLSKEDATKYVKQLESSKRYHVEAWS